MSTSSQTRARDEEDLESRISEDPEQLRPPRPPSPPHPRENIPPPAEEVTHLRLAAHYASLVLSAMIGGLIRLGLSALGNYQGRVIYPIAWSQGVGCGIMGLALARKNEFVHRYPPAYTFVTTGIAGSVTTFSTWMEEGYLSFANYYNYNRGGLYDAVDGLAYSFSTLAIAVACIYLGEFVSTLLPALPASAPDPAPVPGPSPELASSDKSEELSHRRRRRLPLPMRRRPTSQSPRLDLLTIVSAISSYVVALLLYFLAPTVWRHRAVFPILLSPPGAMLRFALSRLNAGRPFPIGTFVANMIASLVLGGVFAQQHRIGSGVTCNALHAIQEGFCGCLSTVSTFAVEVRALRRGWTIFYVFSSVILGHLLVLATVGGVGWSKGLGPVCSE